MPPQRIKAVGESFHREQLHQLIRQYNYGTVPESGDVIDDGLLIREPNNPHDPRAVQVLLAGLPIAHIPRTQLDQVHRMFNVLDHAAAVQAREVTPFKVFVEVGWNRPEVIGVEVSWSDEDFAEWRIASGWTWISEPTPANWYPDPEVPGQIRYWDGEQWTQHVASDRTVASPVAEQPQQAELPPAGWYPDPEGKKKHRYWDGSQWTLEYSTDWYAYCDCGWERTGPRMSNDEAFQAAVDHGEAYPFDDHVRHLAHRDGEYHRTLKRYPG